MIFPFFLSAAFSGRSHPISFFFKQMLLIKFLTNHYRVLICLGFSYHQHQTDVNLLISSDANENHLIFSLQYHVLGRQVLCQQKGLERMKWDSFTQRDIAVSVLGCKNPSVGTRLAFSRLGTIQNGLRKQSMHVQK